MAKIIDESRLKINPFVSNLKIPVTRITEPNKYIDKNGVMQPVEYTIERQQSVKLFYAPGAKDLVGKLTPAGKSLYLYIIYHLESGQDWINLNHKHYLQQTQTKSINTLKTGIADLWDNGFITPTSAYPKDVFWINPILFFSGNRITKFPDKVIVKSEL